MSHHVDLDQLLSQAEPQIAQATSLAELESLQQSLVGKKSLWSTAAQALKTASAENKKALGQTLNQTKQTIQTLIEARRLELKATSTPTSADSSANHHFDTSLPGQPPRLGNLHPTTQVIRQINDFFHYLGYSVYEGPEIETNEFNFEKLNLPPDHPARELADTFYIQEPEILLRTHTSSVEARALTHEELPIRIVVPGKVFRNENANTTNNAMFYQYEGLAVDKNLSLAELKGTLVAFVKFLYGPETRTRFRCKYYPQVEPGAGLDIQCTFCEGKGCSVCKYRGWIEVLGAGMVHPNLLKSCNINPREWSGFAFGLGLDRLVMLKYGINDIRKLYNGELVFESES